MDKRSFRYKRYVGRRYNTHKDITGRNKHAIFHAETKPGAFPLPDFLGKWHGSTSITHDEGWNSGNINTRMGYELTNLCSPLWFSHILSSKDTKQNNKKERRRKFKFSETFTQQSTTPFVPPTVKVIKRDYCVELLLVLDNTIYEA